MLFFFRKLSFLGFRLFIGTLIILTCLSNRSVSLSVIIGQPLLKRICLLLTLMYLLFRFETWRRLFLRFANIRNPHRSN